MKNLKKLVSVIVTVAMLVSSLAALSVSAAYPDVDESNSYAKAIEVLSGLGIVKGDDEGNFNPTNDIKRSEMVALICRMKGEDAIATSTVQEFDDVPSNHWAAGYISWGVASDIIKGYGDGNFGPDASVTLQDAVVMIVRAAGWERIANRSDYGGYPTGHMRIANARGVMDGINFTATKAATREVVAQAIYNGLTMPLVEYISYGENADDDRYAIYDGSTINYSLATLLTNTNKIVKVQAKVLATAKENPAYRSDVDNQQVKLQITDEYGYDVTTVANTLEAGDTPVVYVGETNVADYLGYTVEAYLKYDNSLRDYVLLAAVADESKTVTETLTSTVERFAGYTLGGDYTYYASATAARTTTIDVVASPVVYYNGRVIFDAAASPAIDNVSAVLKTAPSTYCANLGDLFSVADKITFLGDKNADYDTIFVTDYEYRQVVEVNEDSLYIETDGVPVLLDKEDRNDETFVYNLYDAEGNEIELSDIAEDDILNIVAPLTAGGTYNADAIDYLDIYVTSNAVTGSVDEALSNGTYKIDGTAYKPGIALSVGDEGVFYITIDGVVYAKEASSAISKNFALLLGSEIESKFGQDSIEIQVFTAEGKIETFKVASAIKVFDGVLSEVANANRLLISDGTAKAYFNASAFTSLYADQATADAVATALDSRIFTYKLNSNGELSEIRFAYGAGELNKANATAKFNPNTSIFNGTFVTANTILIEAPAVSKTVSGSTVYNVDTDKLKISAFKAMDEDTSYDVDYYTFASDATEIAAAIVGVEITSGTKESKLAVVKSVSSVFDAESNGMVDKYTYIQSGEVKEAKVDPDKSISTMGVGDIFRYTVNAEGEINQVINIYDASAGTFTAGSLVEGNAATNKEWLINGMITKIERNDNGRLVSIDDYAVGGTAATTYLLHNDDANTYVQITEETIGGTNASAGVEVMTSAASLRASYAAQTYEIVALINDDGLIDDAVMVIVDMP